MMLRAIDARTSSDLKWAVPTAVLALALFVIGSEQHWPTGEADAAFSLFGMRFDLPGGWIRMIIVGMTVLFVISGVIAARRIGRALLLIGRAKGGPAAGNAIRLIAVIVGYAIVVLGALSLLKVNMANLLVGGAVTGVIVGIAAQQTIGNFFAGLVLLFARPFVPGQRVKVRNGGMGGPFEGLILSVGLMYTVIDTAEGPVNMPNAAVLGAAIGPAPEPPAEGEEPADPQQPEPAPGTPGPRT